MAPEGSSTSGPGHWSPLGTLVTQTLRVGRCELSTQQRPGLGAHCWPSRWVRGVRGTGRARLMDSQEQVRTEAEHIPTPGGGGQAFWEGSYSLGTTSGWVDEGRSEKPQAHKSRAWPCPCALGAWLGLAPRGGGGLGKDSDRGG